MTRQNYYARRKLRKWRAVDGGLVAQLVKQERCLQPQPGARKMRVLLREPLAEAGLQLSRDRLFEALRGP
jgi:putative transposase